MSVLETRHCVPYFFRLSKHLGGKSTPTTDNSLCGRSFANPWPFALCSRSDDNSIFVHNFSCTICTCWASFSMHSFVHLKHFFRAKFVCATSFYHLCSNAAGVLWQINVYSPNLIINVCSIKKSTSAIFRYHQIENQMSDISRHLEKFRG